MLNWIEYKCNFLNLHAVEGVKWSKIQTHSQAKLVLAGLIDLIENKNFFLLPSSSLTFVLPA